MRIKYFRVKADLSQTDLAEKMEIKRTTVSMWETGASMPTADKLMKLARVLGCTVDELLADDPSPPAASA